MRRARIAQAFDGACAFARTAKNSGDFRRDGSARGCRVTIVAASRVTSACAMRTGDARGFGADGAVATIAIAAGRDDCLQACRSGEGRRGTPSSRAASASRDLSRRHFRVALAATRCPSARRLGAITRTRGAVRGGRRGARASPLSARAGVFAGQVKRFQRTHARVRTRCAREARVGVRDRRTVASATRSNSRGVASRSAAFARLRRVDGRRARPHRRPPRRPRAPLAAEKSSRTFAQSGLCDAKSAAVADRNFFFRYRSSASFATRFARDAHALEKPEGKNVSALKAAPRLGFSDVERNARRTRRCARAFFERARGGVGAAFRASGRKKK